MCVCVCSLQVVEPRLHGDLALQSSLVSLCVLLKKFFFLSWKNSNSHHAPCLVHTELRCVANHMSFGVGKVFALSPVLHARAHVCVPVGAGMLGGKVRSTAASPPVDSRGSGAERDVDSAPIKRDSVAF